VTEGSTTSQYETIRVDWPREHVLRVTLDRPAFSNALNTQMGKELADLFTGLAHNPGDARCVVMTGAGDRAFCAGGDLKERDGMTNEQWLAQHAIFERFFFCLAEFPLPVIGAINGHAYGGGFEMTAAMDFAYGVPRARFALTEVTLGIMPGGGSTQTLPRAIGPRKAKELIFTGRPITAQRALEWGVLNRICEPEELMDAALETAGFIAGNAPLAIRQAKKAIHHGQQTDLTRGLWFEIESYNRLVFTEDRLEGVRAYNEKRPAKFRGV
jgi:enoyl-CoA hydratase/carnithine racemase